MSAMTNYFENVLLEHAIGLTTWTLPTAGKVWIALFDVAPTDATADGGTPDDEIDVGYGGYGRLVVDSVARNWSDPPVNGSVNNDTEVWDFIHDGTAGQAWSVAGVGIFDAATVGNCLLYEAFGTPIAVAVGNTLRFAIGNFAVTFS